MWILSFFTTELPEKAKRLKFYKDFEDGGGSQPFSEQFYYPEDLEILDEEIETGSASF